MSAVRNIIGVAATVVIGGTAYTINQQDVVDNFAEDTGLTQQEAEDYVGSVGVEDLVPYSELGQDFIDDGNYFISFSSDIDCDNYMYEWETPSLTCELGKSQLFQFGTDEISLGNAYISLDEPSAGAAQVEVAIRYLDKLNEDYEFDIIQAVLDQYTIDENKKTNSYNKANLQAVLESM